MEGRDQKIDTKETDKTELFENLVRPGGKLFSKFKEEKYCVYEESVIKRKNWRTKKVLRN